MAEQGDALCGAPEEPQPAGVTLSDSLISTRTRSAGPLPTGTLRLDRENISCIGKSRGQEGIHSLYLQQPLPALGGCDTPCPPWGAVTPPARPGGLWHPLPLLGGCDSPCPPWGAVTAPARPPEPRRFLCLAGNRIQRVQNLQGLLQLSLLDLSHNLIQVLHTEELPRSLRILDLAGNQCTQQEGYRDGVLAALPRLLQLDSQPVRASTAEEEEEGGGGSCSSEDEEDEDEELLAALRAPFTVDRGARGRSGQRHGPGAGSASSPGAAVPPGRFPGGSAPGAGGAGAAAAGAEPGGAPGAPGGAAGAAGRGAGRHGPAGPPALSPGPPRGSAGTAAGTQRLQAAPGPGSAEREPCRRSGKWAAGAPNTLQQSGIKSLFPSQPAWCHSEGSEMGTRAKGAGNGLQVPQTPCSSQE
ncbi:leucine-rich repeat-containing protein 46 [Ammospiza maritima maritima]